LGGETVLIAALSGRALAESARRAGFEVLVTDCFGDADTLKAVSAHRLLPHALRNGFRYRSLSVALHSLASAASQPPIGLVLGTGFEDDPDLIARLAGDFRILGCSAETVRRTKEPAGFSARLAERGIRHPETSRERPAIANGWLVKRRGGSGGIHVHPLREGETVHRHAYFQRAVEGITISAAVISGEKDVAVAWSHQWTNPAPRMPYRYGGAVGALHLGDELEAKLMHDILELLPAFDLRGLVSFDFMICEGAEPLLIEINPRPGATVDVLDDSRGTLFRAHVEASLSRPTLRQTIEEWEQPLARAAAYLYADRGPLTVSPTDWPDWVSDRPSGPCRIRKYQPVCTVITEAETPELAEASCRERLGLVADMLYEKKKGKETNL
jgi:predicted ATP-grasp superfamily ATP-dependent carboligase